MLQAAQWREGWRAQTSCSPKRCLETSTGHFCLYPIGQSLVPSPYPTAGEAGTQAVLQATSVSYRSQGFVYLKKEENRQPQPLAIPAPSPRGAVSICPLPPEPVPSARTCSARVHPGPRVTESLAAAMKTSDRTSAWGRGKISSVQTQERPLQTWPWGDVLKARFLIAYNSLLTFSRSQGREALTRQQGVLSLLTTSSALLPHSLVGTFCPGGHLRAALLFEWNIVALGYKK